MHYDARRDLPRAFGLAVLLLGVLLANGRPIGAGDTRPTERVAASLVGELDFDLDEYPEVTEPFAREVNGRRVSIYPVFSAVLAVPVFAMAQMFFDLDEVGTALAGKLAASLFSAFAAATLFVALRRWGWEAKLASWAAVLFVLGTSLYSTSQALWQHPAAAWMMCLAVLMAVRANAGEEAWAGRAGLPLALALAARHGSIALVAALALGLVVRWPRQAPRLFLWSLPAGLPVLAYQWFYFGAPWRHGFSGSASRFDASWSEGLLGLLMSPGKGLFVFTPLALIALVGIGRAFVQGERWMAMTLGTGVLAHWMLTAKWGEWHGGECFGPRLMTDALSFLFVFLPDGLRLLPRLGAALAAISVGVQALGAFSYDYRWEYLFQRPTPAVHDELWSWTDGPLAFHVRERVVILAAPQVAERHARVREHRLVVLGPRGSELRFTGGTLAVEGERALLGHAHLQRGARVEGDRLQLRRRWDGAFARVTAAGRAGRYWLVLEGEGEGPLYVGEQTFWTPARFTTYMLDGAFRLRHPYHHPESGGPDLLVTLGRGTGRAELSRMALEPAGGS